MLVLHLRLLTGRYMASAYDDRRRGEWPPHPARVYSAMVSALHDQDHVDPAEAAVLDQLAGCPPPWVLASPAHARRVMTHFVPVNDASVTDSASLWKSSARLDDARAALAELSPDAGKRARGMAETAVRKAQVSLDKAVARSAGRLDRLPRTAATSMPWHRTRKERAFPAMVPPDDRVTLLWPTVSLAADDLVALNAVASRVSRIGHSSSLTCLEVAAVAGTDVAGVLRGDDREAWRPDPEGELKLRWVAAGQRVALEAAFERHRGEQPGRVLPATHVRYRPRRRGDMGHTRSTHARWIAYHLRGSQLPPATAAVALATAIRAAILRYADDPAPAALSGHEPSGEPTEQPHLSVLPLPFVGYPHADGAVRGFSILLPRTDEADEQAVLTALGRWELAHEPETREVSIFCASTVLHARRLIDPDEGLKTLRRARWSTPATSWITVTPLALDGHTGPFTGRDGRPRPRARKKVTQLVRRAVQRAVRPPEGRTLDADEIAVEVDFAPPLCGAPHAREMPRFQRAGHPHALVLVHARIELPFAVEGPLILGAGRHFGLGLCAPVPANKAHPR